MASYEEHKAAAKRLRAAGVGAYVVMTGDAGKAGLSTRFPIGQIVGFDDPITVKVRKVGQVSITGFAAGFWEMAPKRLIRCLR